MMEILIFKDEDLTKKGILKKVNNSKTMTKEGFISFIKSNNLTLSYGYIDLIGFISNGDKFRAYYNGIVIGVSGLIKEINGVKA